MLYMHFFLIKIILNRKEAQSKTETQNKIKQDLLECNV